MIWSSLASGEVGTGLRWPGEMFADHALPEQMRKYQLALRNFTDQNIDFATFNPTQIGQYIKVGNTNIPVVKTGYLTVNREFFLVRDNRKATYGTVSGATLTIPKLFVRNTYTFEFWDSLRSHPYHPTKFCFRHLIRKGMRSLHFPIFPKHKR